MDTKLIYAAAATSLDSWDIDNLRYIRKISRGQPLQMTDGDTVSYISEQSEQEDMDSMIPIPSLGVMDNSLLHSPDHHAFPRDLAENFNLPDSAGQRVYEKVDNQSLSGDSSLLPVPVSVPTKGYPPPTRVNNLEDCYLLDIVTVRNESVLAFSSHNYTPLTLSQKPGHNKTIKAKNSVESSSSPPSSCSSASSSTEEQEPLRDPLMIAKPEAKSGRKERDFFDLSLDNEDEEEEDTSIELRDDIRAGNGNQRDTQKRILSMAARERQCPFCDHHSNNPFFHHMTSSPGNLEEVSMQGTVGGEGPAVLPRSPSPYYVRLRRDLLAAITPPPSNGNVVRRPRNFSVTPQGQLAIDYSSNWLGLENYVNNLKR